MIQEEWQKIQLDVLTNTQYIADALSLLINLRVTLQKIEVTASFETLFLNLLSTI